MGFHSLVSLRCSACNENYRQPYILPCLHSYCFDCIEKFKRSYGEETFIKCPLCKQESKLTEHIPCPNYFFVNSLAASKLKDIHERACGNCTEGKSPTAFCEECDEYLCSDCVYCHENTKVTRSHSLIPKDKYKERLSICGHDRAVFCSLHPEQKVEKYCGSCQETICTECIHVGHTVLSLAEAYSVELDVLKELLLKVTGKVDLHEKSAARFCSIADELRTRKGEISDKIRSYFNERKEEMENHEEKLLNMVLLWYDKNFEIIKEAQKDEEILIEKVSNALNVSEIVLKHGTDVEILSMKNLIQSQLNRVASQKTGEKLIAAVEMAIRSASWDFLPEHYTIVNYLDAKESLNLPQIQEPEKDEVMTSSEHGDSWEMVDAEEEIPSSEEKEWNKEKHSEKLPWSRFKNVHKAVKRFGQEKKDCAAGLHIAGGGKKKVWQRLRQVLGGGIQQGELERDYRYDKMLRTKVIGRQGSDCGQFQHPCDIVVDHKREDRLIVSDYNNNRVQVFNYFGEYLSEFGSRGHNPGQLMGPTGVAVLHDGSIVVCDSLNNRVQVFTQDGIFIRSFGQEGRSYGEFWRPMGVAVDSENRIIVVDQGNNRVQVFDSNGDFCFSFGKLGNWDGEVSCPNFIAVDKHDNIYVSDEVNMRIQIFNRDGTYLRKVTSQEMHGVRGNVKLLSGIAVDPRGHIVVGGKNSCTVGIFNPDGRFLRAFSSKRTNDSRVLFATGIALTSDGEIAVCDWFNNRIRFF